MLITNSKLENNNEKCPFQGSEEDHWRTTSYPICTCNGKFCKFWAGYCPVRDDRQKGLNMNGQIKDLFTDLGALSETL